jgi:hypothetical protein
MQTELHLYVHCTYEMGFVKNIILTFYITHYPVKHIRSNVSIDPAIESNA